MMVLKYMGEQYQACAPRIVNVGTRKYTCDAFKLRTGKVVSNHIVLNALGQMLLRGGKW